KTSASISVVWTAPTAPTVIASYYTVKVKTSTGSPYTATGGADLTDAGTFTITGLAASTSYTITIYSGNSAKLYETIGKSILVSTCPIGYSGLSCANVCN